MFDPASPFALAISNLFVFTLIIAALILALVTGLVIYIAIRYRARPGEPEPQPVFGHNRLEIAWTVGPIIILAILLVLAIDVSGKADPSAEGKQPDIEVIGHQWWWEVRYPQSKVVTANEIHMPVGKPMLIRLESADVVHNLWIPKLGRKMDLNPVGSGSKSLVYLQADAPGTYQGACGEYCGTEHAWMLIRAVAQPQADYDAWIKSQQANVSFPTGTNSVAQGAQLFQQKTCISCHAINGTSANAQAGPNLTHFASRQTIGAGVLPNTPSDLAKWLADPQSIKPGSYMPNVQLTPDQVKAMVDYLETLK
jgi:cytochrome c oxidase subunit 2